MKRLYIISATLLIMLVLTACSQPLTNALPTSTGGPDHLEQVLQTLESMQAQWQSQGLDDYRFQFRWNCFCTAGYREPVWVAVEDGEIASIEAVDPQFEEDLPDQGEYDTIDGLFNFIREGIEEEAHQIQVDYDEAMGYPVSAYIDYAENIVDEERGFEILALETQPVPATETPESAALNPAVTIQPTSGPPGTSIQVRASGFPPNSPVNIGVGRLNSEYDVITSDDTDQSGNLDTTITLPDFVTSQDQWVIVVAAVNQDAKAVSDPLEVTQSQQHTEEPENLFTRTNIYLISLGDDGQSGKAIGCDDSVVPLEIEIEPTIAPLTAGLTRLLAIDSQYYGQSGLYNALYLSDLAIDSINIVDEEAIIRLSGDLQLAGVCDEPRFKAQIEETALQFSTISRVSIFINGGVFE